jgi:hypothetical protein
MKRANQITAHNAGWRTSAVAPVFTALRRGRALWRDRQFRLASQARHEMGAPNGLFASQVVVAGSVFWSGPPSAVLLRRTGVCEFYRSAWHHQLL